MKRLFLFATIVFSLISCMLHSQGIILEALPRITHAYEENEPLLTEDITKLFILWIAKNGDSLEYYSYLNLTHKNLVSIDGIETLIIPTCKNINDKIIYRGIGRTKFISQLTLDISNNNLQCLPATLTVLRDLTELNVSGNVLKSFPFDVSKFRFLKRLKLSANKLDTLDNVASTSLEELHLNANQLKSLPSSICELPKLKNLDVSSNELAMLPNDIQQLTDLETLLLTNNQLTNLPQQLPTFLCDLTVRSNKLETVPESLATLTNLTSLDLAHNYLKTLAVSFSLLKALKYLYLQGNKLTQLPSSIAYLPILKQLIVSQNQLQELPETLTRLTDLEVLDISDNVLGKKEDDKQLPLTCFTDLPQHLHTWLRILLSKNALLYGDPTGRFAFLPKDVRAIIYQYLLHMILLENAQRSDYSFVLC